MAIIIFQACRHMAVGFSFLISSRLRRAAAPLTLLCK